MIAVVIPTRLQRAPSGQLYLTRALASVRKQELQPAETIVALGPDVEIPGDFPRGVHVVVGATARHADCVNAAVASVKDELVAFLEDDDHWVPSKLRIQADLMGRYEFVSCNQREEDVDGKFVRYADYPTPSGWLFRTELWRSLGGIRDLRHADSEFLGRMGRLLGRSKRAHVVPPGYTSVELEVLRQRYSEVACPPVLEPLVCRTRNPGGVTAATQLDPVVRQQSVDEVRALVAEYGEVPW